MGWSRNDDDNNVCVDCGGKFKTDELSWFSSLSYGCTCTWGERDRAPNRDDVGKDRY